jgi:hypothetical protein
VLAETLLLDGELREKSFHLGGTQRGRITKAVGRFVETDVLFDPAQVALLGAIGVVLNAERLADLFEPFPANPSR